MTTTKGQPGETGTHTPGPWSVHEDHEGYVVHADYIPDGGVCRVSRQDPQCDGGRDMRIELANARLIAAAPELLEALRGLLEVDPHTRDRYETILRRGQDRCDEEDARFAQIYESSRAAIAKATGKGGAA